MIYADGDFDAVARSQVRVVSRTSTILPSGSGDSWRAVPLHLGMCSHETLIVCMHRPLAGLAATGADNNFESRALSSAKGSRYQPPCSTKHTRFVEQVRLRAQEVADLHADQSGWDGGAAKHPSVSHTAAVSRSSRSQTSSDLAHAV